MSEAFDQKFAEQEDEEPGFPDEFVESLQEFVVVGHLTDEFSYGGQDFVISTMTIGEELEALRAAQKYSDVALAAGRIYATAMVAGSIRHLNGEPLVMALSPQQDIASLKFAKVLDWYWAVIDVVYRRYVALEEKQKETLDALRNTLESDDSQEPADPVE